MSKLKYIIFISLATLIVLITGYHKYIEIFSPNIRIKIDSNKYVYIPTGTVFSEFLEIIKESDILIDFDSFQKTCNLKNYNKNISPGRYRITEGMSNNELVNMFRSGKQAIINLSFNNIRTKEQFARIISLQIEADSISIINILNNEDILSKYETNNEGVLSYFIPNTYQFYWNTNAEQLLERLIKEYWIFWNSIRIEKANNIDLNPFEVSVLASIIDEETEKESEKARIAGVYINRLKRGIPLQADPSIKFALNDFLKKRITTKDLDIDSPYNTYKNQGLPPGPIRIPSISAIDAVLNYEHHSYYYFCAKDDFSGYHVFAKTLRQHNQNASKYHNALNRNRIYK